MSNSPQSKHKSDEYASSYGESNDSESADPERDFGSQESESKESEPSRSDLGESFNDSQQKSETIPNKSKSQKTLITTIKDKDF